MSVVTFYSSFPKEELTAFPELESAIRVCGELSRQAGEMFPKLSTYEKPYLLLHFDRICSECSGRSF